MPEAVDGNSRMKHDARVHGIGGGEYIGTAIVSNDKAETRTGPGHDLVQMQDNGARSRCSACRHGRSDFDTTRERPKGRIERISDTGKLE